MFWSQATVSGTPPQADLDTWLTAVAAAYKTRFAPDESTLVLYTQAQAIMFLPGGLVLPSIVAMTGAGTGTGPNSPNAGTSSVVSWQTGVYWRGGKPRTYLPQPPASYYASADALTSTAQTNLKSHANSFRTDVNGAVAGSITGSSLGFVSFRSGNADRSPPLFFSYADVKIHPRLGTQRRRLGKWKP